MTDETQTPGFEREARDARDPLSLSGALKKPELDYQWFRVSDPPSRWSMNPDDGHWTPVPRADMLSETSHSEEFIQRWEMRLFCRPMYLTEDARKEGMEIALAPITTLEDIHYGTAPAPPMRPLRWLATARSASEDRWEPAWARRNRFETEDKTASWGDAPNRGKILILHHYRIHRRLRPWAARFWRALLLCRVCYLTYDESELAERQGTTFGAWAWAKRDLLREGVIPYYLPQFKFTVRTFEIKIPKVPYRRWWAKLRTKIGR